MGRRSPSAPAVYPRDGIEFSRFVSFLDGGTVVALTLLAVSVLPQSGLTDNEWHKVFAGIMNGSHATFVALVVCFVIVTSFWLDQHHLYSRLRGIDRPVILLNLGYLFLLTLAPVVAVALAEHRRDIYAIWLYVYWATLLTLVSIAMPWLVGRRGLYDSADAKGRYLRNQSLLSGMRLVVLLISVLVVRSSHPTLVYLVLIAGMLLIEGVRQRLKWDAPSEVFGPEDDGDEAIVS